MKRRRKPLSKAERQQIDADTAQRLEDALRKPFREDQRVFEDDDTEPGRLFYPSPYRERWIFAGEGGRRAARLAAEFDCFLQGRDLPDLRHFVLRPKPTGRGKARRIKTAVGDLEAGLRRFAAEYDQTIGKLVSEHLLESLLTIVQPRYDARLRCWDIHAHCVWRVADANIDAVDRRIATRFSKIWRDKRPIRRPGALVNYALQWIVKYRTLKRWPVAALKELWDLCGVRFVRAAGSFATFRRGLKDKTLVRENGQIIVVQKPVPRPRATARRERRADGFLGRARVRLGGKLRQVKIWSISPGEARAAHFETPTVNCRNPQPGGRRHGSRNRSTKAAPGRYPSTSPGLTPPSTEEASTRVRLRPASAWWWRAWPYFGIHHTQRTGWIPKPIKRRLARLAIEHPSVLTSNRIWTPRELRRGLATMTRMEIDRRMAKGRRDRRESSLSTKGIQDLADRASDAGGRSSEGAATSGRIGTRPSIRRRDQRKAKIGEASGSRSTSRSVASASKSPGGHAAPIGVT